MSEFKQRKALRNLMKVAAVGTSVLALAACGEKGSEKDKGTSVIGKCPTGYVFGKAPLKVGRETIRMDLGNAVTQLAAVMPRNGLGDPRVDLNVGTLEDRKVLAAGVEIFHQDDKSHTYKVFEVDSPENRIDDLSEQFCHQGDKLYIAPQTATAIGAMKNVKIDVPSVK